MICIGISVSNHQMYKLVMEKIFDADENLSYDKVLTVFVTSLCKWWDETLGTKEIIQDLLDIKIEELLNGFYYIHRDEKRKFVIIHFIVPRDWNMKMLQLF